MTIQFQEVDNTASISIFDTPVGLLLARASNGQLTQLSYYERTGGEMPDEGRDDSADILHSIRAQIREYFIRRRTRFDLPLGMSGPEFHRRVWAALQEIPYGETVSYGYLASSLGVPGLARAVGAANAANPIAIVVPCHRVIGADGSLVGYGGGLSRKQMLLDLESGRVRLAL